MMGKLREGNQFILQIIWQFVVVGAHTPYWVTPRLVRKFVSGAMGQNSLRGVRVSQNPPFL